MAFFHCPRLYPVVTVRSESPPSRPQSLQLSDLIILFIQLPKQRHTVTEQPISSKTQPRTTRKDLTCALMHRLKLLIVEHMLHTPPCAATSTHALHAPDTQPSRALHARDHQSLSLSCTCQCLHHQLTSAPCVNCLCQHTSAVDFHC